jgi:hypothetical protein
MNPILIEDAKESIPALFARHSILSCSILIGGAQVATGFGSPIIGLAIVALGFIADRTLNRALAADEEKIQAEEAVEAIGREIKEKIHGASDETFLSVVAALSRRADAKRISGSVETGFFLDGETTTRRIAEEILLIEAIGSDGFSPKEALAIAEALGIDIAEPTKIAIRRKGKIR